MNLNIAVLHGRSNVQIGSPLVPKPMLSSKAIVHLYAELNVRTNASKIVSLAGRCVAKPPNVVVVEVLFSHYLK